MFLIRFSTQVELGYDLVKFSIESHKVGEVHHKQLDPIASGLWQVDCSHVENMPPVASTSHLIYQLEGISF